MGNVADEATLIRQLLEEQLPLIITAIEGSGPAVLGAAGVPTIAPAAALEFLGDGVTVSDQGNGLARVEFASSPALTVRESDGTPSAAGVSVIEISGGTVADLGAGVVRVTFAPFSIVFQTLTDAANIVWNAALGASAQVTLGGNRTLSNPTSISAGAAYVLIAKQDSVGGRTLSYSSAYKWRGGVAPVLSIAPNAIDVLTFISDGTHMYGDISKAFA